MKTSELLDLVENKMPEWFVNSGTVENPEIVNLKQLMILKLMELMYREAKHGVD